MPQPFRTQFRGSGKDRRLATVPGLHGAVYGTRARLHQFQRHSQPGAGRTAHANPPLSGELRSHFANATDVFLPTAVEPLVAGIMGLHDFTRRRRES